MLPFPPSPGPRFFPFSPTAEPGPRLILPEMTDYLGLRQGLVQPCYVAAGPVSWDLLKTDIQCSSVAGNLDCLRRRLLWRWKTRLSPVDGEKPKNVAEDIEDKLIFPQTIFRIFASLCSPQFLLGTVEPCLTDSLLIRTPRYYG